VAPAGVPAAGYGVFATRDLAAGEFVLEYKGDVVPYDRWCAHIRELKSAQGQVGDWPYVREELYGMSITEGEDVNIIIDGATSGGVARFINHSCFPNCSVNFILAPEPETYGMWRYHAAVYTKRPIPALQQLSLDYVWYDASDGASETVASVQGEAARLFNSAVGLANARVGPPTVPQREACWREGEDGVGAPSPVVRVEAGDAPRVHCGVEEAGEELCAAVLQLPEGDRYEIREGGQVPADVRMTFLKAGAWAVGIGCMCNGDSSLNDNHVCSGVIGLDVRTCLRDNLPLPLP
jgi:hypothetical protein